VEQQKFEDFKNQIIEKLNTDIYTLSQRLEALEWQIQRYMNTPGPPGVKGDRGAVGQKGDKGIKGEKGERGDLGYMMSVFGFPAIVFYGLENQLLASNASMRLMHRQKERTSLQYSLKSERRKFT